MSNYAAICLDETGSMTGQEERVVTSLNEYVRSLPDDIHVTVFKFDSARWTTLYDDSKSNWTDREVDDYQPGSMTPLYDAIYKTIKHAESLAQDGDKVLVMIDTDGIENASKEYTREGVRSLVEQKKSSGWEFLFMAAGLDEAEAARVGSSGQDLGMTTQSASYSLRSANYMAASAHSTDYFNGTTKPGTDKPRKPAPAPARKSAPARKLEPARSGKEEPFGI